MASPPPPSPSVTSPSISSEHDLAALIVPTELGSMPAATEPVAVGDSVAVGGFGRDGRLALMTGEVIYRGPGDAYGTERPDIYVLSAEIEAGWSGGPVVNPDGEVVAVIVGIERASGTAIAVPITYLPQP